MSMKVKSKTKLMSIGLAICLAITVPAWANVPEDEVGSATTIYQQYLKDGASGEISMQTNVPGESPTIENYLDDTIDLATRLVPFSYDASLGYRIHANPTPVTVTFRNRDLNDRNAEVKAIVNLIVTNAKNNSKNNYEMLEYFNRYIVDNCVYDTEAVKNPDQLPRAYTAYGCLVEGKAVCEGYTNAMLLLCEKANIPCIKVIGTANGGNHIWNAVYLDGKWWMLDVTFNDPVGNAQEEDHWLYFLLDMDTFQQKGLHVYQEQYFAVSKEIYTGKTVGQLDVSLPFAGLSLEDAQMGDSLDAYRQIREYGVEEDAALENREVGTNANVDAEETVKPLESEDTIEKMDGNNSDKTTESLTIDQKAEALKEAGLFMGDEQGFRLAEPMTRVEMGVMVMRMNDGKQELAEQSQHFAEICPFQDVPLWAVSTIGYLYEKKLVAGMSDTTFGVGNVTKRDYAVMMLRVLKIDHTYEGALQTAVEHGLLTAEMAQENGVATRGDVVYMTFATQSLRQLASQTA